MPEAPPTRRLAAIVSSDIAGYSSLAERDERLALERVGLMRDLAHAAARAGGGRIFNTAGDGVMLEFNTASDALAAAASLVESELGAHLRFGVHLGEVVSADNGDVLGHGVNVAARLQAE